VQLDKLGFGIFPDDTVVALIDAFLIRVNASWQRQVRGTDEAQGIAADAGVVPIPPFGPRLRVLPIFRPQLIQFPQAAQVAALLRITDYEKAPATIGGVSAMSRNPV